MTFSVVWSADAESDLVEIAAFIDERNPFAARRLVSLIRESTVLLTYHPYLFKRSERMPDCREIVAHPNYIVIYRVEIDSIEILRVLHARQQYPDES
jgi:toxin ParE1/3/4